jgi:hypothetical protein
MSATMSPNGGSPPMPPSSTTNGTSATPPEPNRTTSQPSERTSVRAQIATAAACVIFLCGLWALMAIPRSQELNAEKSRDHKTLITTSAPASSSGRAPLASSPTTSTGGSKHTDLILAGISICLVFIGIVVRAATYDVQEEKLAELRDEAHRATLMIWLRDISMRPTQRRKERISRKLDVAPEEIGNKINAQRDIFEEIRDRAAAKSPLSQGVWESKSDRAQYTKEHPAKIYDPEILLRADIKQLIVDLRKKAVDNDPETPLLKTLQDIANRRLQKITGVTVGGMKTASDTNTTASKPSSKGRRSGRGGTV